MTTSQSGASSMAQYTTNQCGDAADFDNWFDFNNMASPTPGNSKGRMSTSQIPSALTSPTSTIVPLEMGEDHQTPVQPSHEYARFKQQTGLPIGAMDHLRALNGSSQQNQQVFGSFNSGIDELSLGFDGLDSQSGFGSMTGDLGLDLDLGNGSLPAMFYPNGESSQSDDFVDPAVISKQEEAQANIRFYPGMHQQAALAKQAEQQKQQMLVQQQRQRQAAEQQQQQRVQQSSSRRSASHQPIDPRAEETIARVVNQIRQSSSLSASSEHSQANIHHQVIKAKRDEDEMDEDERLLNSEEGKKLSSKERRQLRNKVSARAFRSRRKEYIGQLEGDIATKSNELMEIKRENHALREENARFRDLAEKLLSHPAFHPFLDELSREPALAESLARMGGVNQAVSATPMPNPAAKDLDPFSATSQQFIPQQNESTHIGMALVPETPIDLSTLNLGGGSSRWAMSNTGMPTFQQPQVFAVTEISEPAEPISIESLSGKGSDDILSRLANDDEKVDYPEIQSPVVAKDEPTLTEQPTQSSETKVTETPRCGDDLFDEVDPTPTSTPQSQEFEPIFGEIPCEKAFAHFELFVSSEQDNQHLMERFERMCARLDATCSRLEVLTSDY